MKRIFWYIILGVVIISCSTPQKTQENIAVQRPNIILILADDHAEAAISAYGSTLSTLAPTPNIDRIATEGAIFRNNYCTNAICGPSRATILTGKYSHINGFRMNGEKFDGDQPTFPKMLQQAGYQTAFYGKWHLDGNPQGFDQWKMLVDQGHYYNPDFIIGKDTLRETGYVTDIITQDAIDFLQKKRNHQQPFLLMVYQKAPHRNWMPALRHLNVYDSITFPLPETYFQQPQNSWATQQQLQTIYRDMYEGHDLKMSEAYGSTKLAHNPWKTDFERMTPAQRGIWDAAYLPKNNAFHSQNLSGRKLAEWKGNRYLHEYLSTIKSVDEGVGAILAYLDQSGLADNTLVIYSSDQGFYLGEKGMFDKRFMYEPSFKMPLLVRYPKKIKAGTEITALTQNTDFAETFLDFAGVDIPNDMQGKSFKNLLLNPQNQEDFREAVYYHYYDYPAFHMVKRMYGVKTKRYKLIHVYDDIDQWEMYDLQNDPEELNNLYDYPNYALIQSQLHHQLSALQKQYNVTAKEFEKVPEAQIQKAYENFKKLRGVGTSYDPIKDTQIITNPN